MHILYALPHSPWSEKARWALDRCGVPFREKAYLPRLGEPLMRLRCRRWRGRITVPILLAEGQELGDSYDIARWAAERTGVVLFPEGQEENLLAWRELSDRMLAAGRRRTGRAVLGDEGALRASMATGMKGADMLPLWVGRDATRWLLEKYADLEETTPDEEILEDGMRRLQRSLDGRETLLGHFSFADICMAVALQFVSPPVSMRPYVPEAAWPHWCVPRLTEGYADLVRWRDRLYLAR